MDLTRETPSYHAMQFGARLLLSRDLLARVQPYVSVNGTTGGTEVIAREFGSPATAMHEQIRAGMLISPVRLARCRYLPPTKQRRRH